MTLQVGLWDGSPTFISWDTILQWPLEITRGQTTRGGAFLLIKVHLQREMVKSLLLYDVSLKTVLNLTLYLTHIKPCVCRPVRPPKSPVGPYGSSIAVENCSLIGYGVKKKFLIPDLNTTLNLALHHNPFKPVVCSANPPVFRCTQRMQPSAGAENTFFSRKNHI